ncbi:MAG: hypothetical protein HN337_00235 [Deltaproteobacteria bacterium]|jgi:required for meiotic nuclear division protein 1|nr:hypothetical protein [Deltaproteobacteria bacterium]
MTMHERFSFKACNFADTLKLKGVERILDKDPVRHTSTKLIYEVGENSYIFIYRFGSVVFFNVNEADQKEILEKINSFLDLDRETQISEDYFAEIGEGERSRVGFHSVLFDKITVEKLDILALVLGQSTTLEYFENRVDGMLARVKEVGGDLQAKGRLARSSKNIKKFIGRCITTKERLVSSLYFLDKPDETWEDPVLDMLHREASEMFEIRDRYKTLDYKLRMIQENLELIADLLQHRYSNMLEWTIIILIAVEIVLFFFGF